MKCAKLTGTLILNVLSAMHAVANVHRQLLMLQLLLQIQLCMVICLLAYAVKEICWTTLNQSAIGPPLCGQGTTAADCEPEAVVAEDKRVIQGGRTDFFERWIIDLLTIFWVSPDFI